MIKNKWQRIVVFSQLRRKNWWRKKIVENGGEMGKEVDRKKQNTLNREEKMRKRGTENDNNKKGSSLTEHLALVFWEILDPTPPSLSIKLWKIP